MKTTVFKPLLTRRQTTGAVPPYRTLQQVESQVGNATGQVWTPRDHEILKGSLSREITGLWWGLGRGSSSAHRAQVSTSEISGAGEDLGEGVHEALDEGLV